MKLIRPKTKKEIAFEYGQSPVTISRYFKALGIETKKMITIAQLRIFYEHYGWPED
jgi:hypothetical protein